MSSISLIVTTCGSQALLTSCLTSLRDCTYLPDNIEMRPLVVLAKSDETASADKDAPDGASDDSSRAALPKDIDALLELPGGRVLEVPRTTLAGSLNRGIAEVEGDYLVFLHDDVVFEYSDWLVNLVEALRRAEDIGVVGGKLVYPDNNLVESIGYNWHEDEKFFVNDFRLFPLDHHLLTSHRDCVAISGALMACRRQVLETVEGFDESLSYGEDIDFCLRARQNGWRTLYSPFVIAKHHSATTREDPLDEPGPPNVDHIKNTQKALLAKWSKEIADNSVILRNGSPVARTLVVRWGGHKDVLMATPVLKALKEGSPETQLAVATRCSEVLLDLPYVDRVFTNTAVFDEAYDRMVMLEHEKDPTRHPLDTYATQAEVLLSEQRTPEVAISAEDRLLAESIVDSHGLAAFHVGPVSETRGWPIERFAEVARYCQEEADLTVAQVGTLDAPSLGVGLDLRGRLTIQQTAAVLAKSKLFIGIDSLPSHLAQAVGTPSIVLYGCVNPELRMTNPAVVTPVTADIDCRPCFHKGPTGPESLADCYTGALECVELVASQMVIKAVTDKLAELRKTSQPPAGAGKPAQSRRREIQKSEA